MRDRLKYLLKYLDIKQKKFAEIIGISASSVSDYFNERSNDLASSTVAKIVTKFNVNPTWLLTGSGEMFLTGENTPSGLRPSPPLQGEQSVQETTPDYNIDKKEKTEFKTIEGGAKTPAPHEVTRENLHQSDWFRALSRNKKMVVLLIDAIEDEKFLADAVEYLSYKVEKEKKLREEEKTFVSQKGETG